MVEKETLKKGDIGKFTASKLTWEVIEEIDSSSVKIRLQGCGDVIESIQNVAAASGIKIVDPTKVAEPDDGADEMQAYQGWTYLNNNLWRQTLDSFKNVTAQMLNFI